VFATHLLEWFPPPEGADHIAAEAAAFRIAEAVNVYIACNTKK
jgi:hypothetical protein